MKLTTKNNITDYNVKVPKGIVGIVIGVCWGDQDGYVVDFPQASRVFVKREDAVIMEETNALQKSCSQEEEGKIGKSKRKKELPPPTVGKGSIPD
jgi:hypothetical protein